MLNNNETTSTRPYLVRAIYEWCTDNGLTPYIAVKVDETVQVPREYVKDGEIVLNVSFDATSALKLGNDFIEFKARFGGISREILVPISHVIAIYSRENGQGMSFPLASGNSGQGVREIDSQESHPVSNPKVDAKPHQLMAVDSDKTDDGTDPPRPSSPMRPSLKRVK